MYPGLSETTENSGEDRAFVLFNPRAGDNGSARKMPRIVSALRRRFRECVTAPTVAQGSATEQARDAIAAGFTHLIICGGDGTLLEALQAAVGTRATLGILPMGTGNVVARDLGLASDPVRAAEQLAGFRSRTVPVGVVETEDWNGYFLASAGVGLHAELMRLPKHAGAGRLQYYANGLQMLATAQRPEFAVKLTGLNGEVSELTCNELLVTRVRSYGGLLQRWQPGCGLADGGFAVTVSTTRSFLRTLAFVGGAVAGIASDSAEVWTTMASRVECSAIVHGLATQVDGTSLGGLPVRFSTRKNAVRLLMPTS